MKEDQSAQDEGYPNIGDFSPSKGLLIEQVPNGGWVVRVNPESNTVIPDIIGAYSTANDMLSALSKVIT